MAEIPRPYELSPNAETIKLFHPFILFPQEKTYVMENADGIFMMDRTVLLDTERLVATLPLLLAVGTGSPTPCINALTPYAQDGYQFQGDEVDPVAFGNRLARLDLERQIDLTVSPWTLLVSTSTWMLSKNNLAQKEGEDYVFLPDVLSLVKRLRIIVSFPSLETAFTSTPKYTSFVARAWPAVLSNGDVFYEHFRPIDSPERSVPEQYENNVFEGCYIHLPANRDLAATWQGKVTLMDEDAEEI